MSDIKIEEKLSEIDEHFHRKLEENFKIFFGEVSQSEKGKSIIYDEQKLIRVAESYQKLKEYLKERLQELQDEEKKWHEINYPVELSYVIGARTEIQLILKFLED